MIDLFNRRVTVYNDIPADTVNPRRWHRTVVEDCNIQGQMVEKMQGTVRVVSIGNTVIFKDKSNYVDDLASVPADRQAGKFTLRVGDFIVFDAVDDEVTTAQDFATLQKKYKDNGMVVGSVSDYDYGMGVDNITVTA